MHCLFLSFLCGEEEGDNMQQMEKETFKKNRKYFWVVVNQNFFFKNGIF